VPKDVAVVGVDNDELLCELANPTLSSVALNAVMGGYRAAGHLDQLMRGKTPRAKVLSVEALRVVQRTSSDSVASNDRAIATALEFIQQTKGRGIKVEDVARHAKLSRRDLDARFGAGVGRTVLTEIQRVRLEYAKRLLEETDYPIPHVAEQAGYSSASYMVQVFRNRLDMTPAKYRASVRMLSIGGEAGL
jgi:LacI family transcriptional regulator